MLLAVKDGCHIFLFSDLKKTQLSPFSNHNVIRNCTTQRREPKLLTGIVLGKFVTFTASLLSTFHFQR